MALLHLLGAVLCFGALLGSHASRDDSEVEALTLFARGAAAKMSSHLTVVASAKTARHHQNEHALVVLKTPDDCTLGCAAKPILAAKTRCINDCKDAAAVAAAAVRSETESDLFVTGVENAARVNGHVEPEGDMTCENNPALKKKVTAHASVSLNPAQQDVFDRCMKELVDNANKNLFNKLSTLFASAQEKIAAAVKYAKTEQGQLLAIKTAKTVAGITMLVVSIACPPAAALGLGLGIGLNVFFSGLEAAHAVKAGASVPQAAGMFFFNVGKGLTMSLIGLPIGDVVEWGVDAAGHLYTAATYADMLCGMLGDGKAGLDALGTKEAPAVSSSGTKNASDVGFMAEGKSYLNCFGRQAPNVEYTIDKNVTEETL